MYHQAGYVCLCFQCWMKTCSVVENFLLNSELQLYLCITIIIIFSFVIIFIICGTLAATVTVLMVPDGVINGTHS